ncbi:MAG: ABC transporter permease [Bacteroidota bacterium]
MLRNFFLVAYRSMARQTSYTLINILGLAIGIACSLVIFLFVYGEWSYDRGYKNSDRIYKVGVSFFNMGAVANGPERLFDVLPQQFEGIQAATRINARFYAPLEVEGKHISEYRIFFTDSSFFKVFQYEFIAGDARSVLRNPNEVVVTEEAAMKYFGRTDVVGQMVTLDNGTKEFFISGVVKDIDFNSTVKSPFFFSIYNQLKGKSQWSSASVFNFFLTKENVDRKEVEAALDRVIEKDVFPEHGKVIGASTFDEYLKNPKRSAVSFDRSRRQSILSRSSSSRWRRVVTSRIFTSSRRSLCLSSCSRVLTSSISPRLARRVGRRKSEFVRRWARHEINLCSNSLASL